MTENILEFDALLAPISEDNPVGADLRADTAIDALYYKLRDARAAARTAERQAIADGESINSVTSSWKPLEKLCIEVLSKESKDLEIACWLTECLVRTNGFAGLRDGFRLLRELISTYWPDIYPPEDEEGITSKLAAFVGLNGENIPGTLIMPIHCVPIVSSNGEIYATWQYQQAHTVAQVTDADKKQKRIDDGAVDLEVLQAAAKATSPEFFNELKDGLQGAREEFVNLYEVLAEKCAELVPAETNIRHALDDCDKAVAALTKHLINNEDTTEQHDDTADDVSLTADVKGDRQDLFVRLQEMVNFFRRTEPHSPISYLLEQAIRWGNMELPELMQELLAERNILHGYYRMVGIKPPKTEENSESPEQNMGMDSDTPDNTDNNFEDFGSDEDSDFNPSEDSPPFPGHGEFD